MSPFPPTSLILLRAGPLQMRLDADGALRWISCEGAEIWRGLYVAVRDANWNTIAPVLEWTRREIGADAFDLAWDARCQSDAVDFTWRGNVIGRATGEIIYQMEGRAERDFWRNRIGFCLLHPMSCAGTPCVLQREGARQNANFPVQIAPHQPFGGLDGLDHQWRANRWARARFTGDSFETEDQRNWTDASFKTYCTPLALPFPVRVAAGERMRQSVTLAVPRARDAARSAAIAVPQFARETEEIALEIAPASARQALPQLGLGATACVPSAPQIERLRALHLSHLRADVHLASGDFTALDAAWNTARALDVALELALLVPQNLENEGALEIPLAALGAHLTRTQNVGAPVRVARWLSFGAGYVTTPGLVARARRVLGHLAPGAAWGGGSNANFAELNRAIDARLLDASELDFLSTAVNPQVHAFDDDTLLENAGALATMLDSAHQLAARAGRALPIVVSPITLKPRFNAVATAPETRSTAPGAIDPATVDARQNGQMGALYTLICLASLVRGGAQSATFYETCGPRGVMAAGDDAAFPLFAVLAGTGEFSGGTARAVTSAVTSAASDRIGGLWLERGPKRALWLFNAGDETQTVRVHLPGVIGAPKVSILRGNALRSRSNDEAKINPHSSIWRYTLAPHDIARADWPEREVD